MIRPIEIQNIIQNLYDNLSGFKIVEQLDELEEYIYSLENRMEDDLK